MDIFGINYIQIALQYGDSIIDRISDLKLGVGSIIIIIKIIIIISSNFYI